MLVDWVNVCKNLSPLFSKMTRRTRDHLSSLPCEVRRHLWSYCVKKDLKVLSLCCKWLCADVKPDLWNQVKISWPRLQEMTPELIHKPHPNLQMISRLMLGKELDEDSYEHYVHAVKRRTKGYLSFGFMAFLQNCDANRLKSLTISSILVADGLQLVGEMFPQLEDLKLLKLSIGRHLEQLSLLGSLKSLTLYECDLKQSFWDNLYEQTLIDAGNTDECGALFNVKNLIELALFNTYVSTELYFHVSKHCFKLETLTINLCNLRDEDFAHIQYIKTLKRVRLITCQLITDDSLSYISRLPRLERLVIDSCQHITPKCFKEIGKITTLRRLDLHTLKPAKDADISHLVNLKSLHTLVIGDIQDATNEALKYLGQLQHLSKLNISDNNNFTDEGLHHLAKLPRLRQLALDSENVTEEALKKHGLLKIICEAVRSEVCVH